MGVDRVRVSILSQPVAFMLTLRDPCESPLIPVGNDLADVFPVLLVGVRAVVRAVLPDDLYVPGELEISVADQIHGVIHGEMPVCVVIVRQRDLKIPLCGRLVSPHHRRAVFVPAVIDDDVPVVAPHLVADPVSAPPCVGARAAQRVISLRPHAADFIRSVVVDPDPPDTAVKGRPLVVEHDDLRVRGIELDVSDPAFRNGLLIAELSAVCVVNAEIAVQPFLLHPAVDVIDGAAVKAASFRLRVIVQRPPVCHGHAEVFSVRRYVGEGGDAA